MIADSSEVEVLLIPRNNMHLFPEEVQTLLSDRLAKEFAYEQPYSKEITQFIQEKFKEWDRFKIKSYLLQTRLAYEERVHNFIKATGYIKSK